MQLLLKQRVEHDGGSAGIFEVTDAADLLRKRGCGRHQRRAQLHAKIFRA